MQTSELIDNLVANLSPVDHRDVSRLLGTALAVGILAAVLVTALSSGVRPDIKTPEAMVALGVKLMFTCSIITLAFAGLVRLAHPGKVSGASRILLTLPFAIIGVLAVASLLAYPGSARNELVMGDAWHGLILIPILAIVPYGVLVWAIRQAAPVNLWRTGALTGLAAGAISAGAYALSCTEDSFPFVACWYGSMMLVCTMFGAVVGARLLRW